MENSLITVGLAIIAILVFLGVVGFVLSRMYVRSTRAEAFVRTGAGGKKVVRDGGALVFPLLHEISTVNMKTLKLEVSRRSADALITQDSRRVDVGVQFYVSVKADDEGIAQAAQTLGDRTKDVEALKEMIEGKLVDGLRSAAAKMSMQGLHKNRADFVQDVKNTVAEDLEKNGLILESVSLTSLDQTPIEQLNENNSFDAEGLRLLTAETEKSRMERAKIKADTDIAVNGEQLRAAKNEIEVTREEEDARITMERELATKRAVETAETAKAQEESQLAQEQARIDREREAEVAEQSRKIAVNEKSEEESRARAQADLARAEAKKAEEAIKTVTEVAEAERKKQTALIAAQESAEVSATRIRIESQAEKEAAQNRADAKREEAKGASDAAIEVARGEAEALSTMAAAKKVDMLAEAEGRQKIVEADNAISPEIVAMKLKQQTIAAMPGIVTAAVAPMQHLDSFKIHQITGLNGVANANGSPADGSGSAPIVNQAVDGMLKAALQLPIVRKLGEEVGVSMTDGLEGLVGALSPDEAPAKKAPSTEEPAASEEAFSPDAPSATAAE